MAARYKQLEEEKKSKSIVVLDRVVPDKRRSKGRGRGRGGSSIGSSCKLTFFCKDYILRLPSQHLRGQLVPLVLSQKLELKPKGLGSLLLTLRGAMSLRCRRKHMLKGLPQVNFSRTLSFPVEARVPHLLAILLVRPLLKVASRLRNP